MVIRTKLASIALGMALLLCGTGVAKAEHWSDGKCRSKIRKEQRDLDRAEQRFGPWSRQANQERFELNQILNRCGYDRDNRYYNHYRDRDRDDWWRH
ncbi:MAG: hypothetical protein WBN92_06225 [Terriglobia bacterium]